ELAEGLEPLAGVAAKCLAQLGRCDVKPAGLDRARRRNPPDRGLVRAARAADPLDYPLEHAHVLAGARPEEATVRVAAEPVHTEDLRRIGHTRARREPGGEVIVPG